jgi:hypothetical protein
MNHTNGHTAIAPVIDHHKLVRERGFLPSTSLAEICAHLNDSNSTGTLMIDFSQGAMNSIRFREEQKVSFDDNK